MPVIRSPTRHRYLCELPYSIEEDRQRPTDRNRRSETTCGPSIHHEYATTSEPTEPANPTDVAKPSAAARYPASDKLYLYQVRPDSEHQLSLSYS